MTEQLWLCLDQGGQGSRAILYDQEGHERAAAYKAVDTYRRDKHVEQDPHQLVDSLRVVVSECRRQVGEKTRITAAGLATQRSSIVAWRKSDGRPLTPVISWQDTRAADILAAMSLDAAQIRRVTGLLPSPHYGASKIRWCLDNDAAVQAAANSGELIIGPLSSFLCRHLTASQQNLVDPCNASRTLLCNVARNDYDEQLLDAFGIKRDQLPAVVANAHHFGEIQNIPLCYVTGDQSTIPFCAGSPREDTVYINVGTGAFVQTPVEQAMSTRAKLLNSILSHDSKAVRYALEGTVNGAAAALQWFEQHHATPIDLSQALATHASPSLFLNRVGGLGSPFWRTDLTPRFVDENASAMEKVAAIGESIAFLIAANIDAMQQAAPNRDRLLMVGGLAQSTPFCQRLADLCQRPITRPSIREATCAGLLQQVSGIVCASGAGAIISPKFDPGLDERFQRFMSVIVA